MYVPLRAAGDKPAYASAGDARTGQVVGPRARPKQVNSPSFTTEVLTPRNRSLRWILVAQRRARVSLSSCGPCADACLDSYALGSPQGSHVKTLGRHETIGGAGLDGCKDWGQREATYRNCS